MDIDLIRYRDENDYTQGLFFINGFFQCHTLEDEFRSKKVHSETRVWSGRYKLALRKEGGFHNRYLKKFGEDFHKGMLWVKDVPDFEYILIHQGNTDEHTSGCLIVGDSQQDLDVNFNGMVGSSANAYKKLYPKVSAQLLAGNEVTIEYSKIQLEPQEPNDVYEKLQEISGEIKVLNAKLSGRNIT